MQWTSPWFSDAGKKPAVSCSRVFRQFVTVTTIMIICIIPTSSFPRHFSVQPAYNEVRATLVEYAPFYEFYLIMLIIMVSEYIRYLASIWKITNYSLVLG